MSDKDPKRIIAALTSEPWLISEEGHTQLLAIAHRSGDIDAVKAVLEQRHPDTYESTVRGSVGVIPIQGPIFPKANLMTDMSGATALSQVALDHKTMLNDDKIETILFDVRSPGGRTDGIHEMAQMIYNARGQKKTVSYVGALAASAGYWLVAACDEIVVDATARLGNIGVVAAMQPKKEGDAVEYTNTASPHKRYDPETVEGKRIITMELDGIADVFISSVAQFRGVEDKKVRKDFGKGAMLVGQDAIDAGMADRLGSYEELISELNGSPNRKGEQDMDIAALTQAELAEKRPDLVSAIQNGATEPLVAIHQTAIAEKDTSISTLKTKVSGLEEENTSLKSDNDTNNDRIAKMEKKDAIRDANDVAAQATGIVDTALTASTIPGSLHDKVRTGISHEKFVTEGVLNTETFAAHVAEDVKSWEKGLVGVAPIKGVGTHADHGEGGGEGENGLSSEEDAMVARMAGDKTE